MADKIIDTLNDLSKAIEEMAKSLQQKKTEEKNVLNSFFTSSSGKIVEEIKLGVKNIKKDTEEILKNQKTLISLSKDKQSKAGLFEGSSEKKSKIKDGVSTVLLIAAGVLAIGVAFKMIGQVDFLSVIALSISLPLVAMAFEKIAQMKDLKPAEMKNIFFTIVTMATSITVASWIMGMIRPISIWQGVTAILIAGTFAVVSYGIEKIAKGVKDVTAMDLIKMPLVLFSVGLAITLASQVMGGIKPISIGQGVTAILIAGTFAVISYGIEGITKSIKNINAKQMALMPVVLVTFALAITLSSQIMRGIHVITIGQALTGIAVAATLAIMALALPALAYAVEKTDLKTAAKMVLILPLLALSIAASSWALQLVVPVKDLFGVVLLSLAVGVMGVAVGATMWALNAMGVGPKEAFLGGLSIIIIAGTIAAASQLLALGNYNGQYPGISWAAGVGLSIVGFGLSAIILGAAMETGAGAIALGLGVIGVLAVAGAILATSAILGVGTYGNYPTLAWSSGVALSLGAFGIGMLGLGAFILGSFGAGLLVLGAGAAGVMVVSKAIVDSSVILGTGVYTGGPTKEWAEGISLALGAFAPIFKVLFDRGIIGLFSKGPSADDFAKAITTVSNGIVTAGQFFMKVPNIWTGGPTAEWSAGVGGALAAFTPIFDALAKSSGLFGSGPSPSDMIKAMTSVAGGIVAVGKTFADANGEWSMAPTSEWSAGVSAALSAFAPIFDYLNANSGWFSTPTANLTNAITGIANAIVSSSIVLANGNYTSTIPEGYMKSMSDNIKAYVDIIEYLQNKNVDAFSFIDTLSITYGLTKLSQGYDKLAASVKSLTNSLNTLDVEKLTALNRLTGGIILMSLMDSDQFEKMMDALEAKAGIFVKVIEELEQEKGSKSFGTIGSIKTGGSQTNSTDQQMLIELQGINLKMGMVANSCRAFVSYIDEIRGANNNFKTKKHY